MVFDGQCRSYHYIAMHTAHPFTHTATKPKRTLWNNGNDAWITGLAMENDVSNESDCRGNSYSLRSLGGMISRCGLLDARASGMTEEAIWSAIEDLFANYRLPEKNAEPVFATTERPFHEVKMGEACKHSIRIHFIGVWDTVGAVGVPDDLDFGPFNQVSNLVAHLKVENFHFIPPTNYLVPARQHYLWYPLKRIDSLAVRLECLVQ